MHRQSLNCGVSFRPATADDVDCMIKIVGNYYLKLKLVDTIKNKSEPPWAWMLDPTVEFTLMLHNNLIIGFFVARHLPANTHLHSFFIEQEFRGFGFGKRLIAEHWSKCLTGTAETLTFSLHVHAINNAAADFYKQFGYQKIEQTQQLLQADGGIGCWARNCESKDQWPLRKGIDLYGLPVSRAKNLIEFIKEQ